MRRHYCHVWKKQHGQTPSSLERYLVIVRHFISNLPVFIASLFAIAVLLHVGPYCGIIVQYLCPVWNTNQYRFQVMVLHHVEVTSTWKPHDQLCPRGRIQMAVRDHSPKMLTDIFDRTSTALIVRLSFITTCSQLIWTCTVNYALGRLKQLHAFDSGQFKGLRLCPVSLRQMSRLCPKVQWDVWLPSSAPAR